MADKDWYPNQKEISEPDKLKAAIEKACCRAELNELRLSVVKIHDMSLLKIWQDKYWSMGKCPTCGRKTEDGR